MKRITSLILALIFTLAAYASLPPGNSATVLESFHRDFPNIQQQTVHDYGDFFIVYFKDEQNSSCRAFYDSKNALLSVIKYYEVSNLNPFIRSVVNEKYPGKAISGITEVFSENSHFYEINVQDTNVWYQVKCYSDGTMVTEKKWRKA